MEIGFIRKGVYKDPFSSKRYEESIYKIQV